MLIKMTTIRNVGMGMLVAIATTIAFAAINVMTPLASAQTGDISGNGGALYCRNGTRDYGNFLSAVISYDGFSEYWKDILVRYNKNLCLYLDIDSLLNRVNKTRELIRKAFYTCDSSATRLEKTYYALEGELFFLRKFVTFSDNGNIGFLQQPDIHNQFIGYVVDDKKFMNNEDAEKLFEQFWKKYQARQEAYLNCKDPSWQNLIQKWNEFTETLGGLGEGKKAAETINSAGKDMVNTPVGRTGNILGGLVEMKINGLPPEESLNEILGELKKNTPGGVTFDQARAGVVGEKARFEDAFIRTTYLAQYQQQYRQSSGEILKEIIDRLTYLQTTIMDTFEFLRQAKNCTKGLLDKTCG